MRSPGPPYLWLIFLFICGTELSSDRRKSRLRLSRSQRSSPKCEAAVVVSVISDSNDDTLDAEYRIRAAKSELIADYYAILQRNVPITSSLNWSLPERSQVTIEGHVRAVSFSPREDVQRISLNGTNNEDAFRLLCSGLRNDVKYSAILVIKLKLKKFEATINVHSIRDGQPTITMPCTLELSDEFTVAEWIRRCVEEVVPPGGASGSVARMFVSGFAPILRVDHRTPAAEFYRTHSFLSIRYEKKNFEEIDMVAVIYDRDNIQEQIVTLELLKNTGYRLDEIEDLCEISFRQMGVGPRHELGTVKTGMVYFTRIDVNRRGAPFRKWYSTKKDYFIRIWNKGWMARLEYAPYRTVKLNYIRSIPIFPDTTAVDIFHYNFNVWEEVLEKEKLYHCTADDELHELANDEKPYKALWHDETSYLISGSRLTDVTDTTDSN